MTDDEMRAAYQDWHKVAVANARAILKPGDRITFTSCPGTKRWAIFTGWDGNWCCSATRDDISAASISKVNGEARTFTEGPRPPIPPARPRPKPEPF